MMIFLVLVSRCQKALFHAYLSFTMIQQFPKPKVQQNRPESNFDDSCYRYRLIDLPVFPWLLSSHLFINRVLCPVHLKCCQKICDFNQGNKSKGQCKNAKDRMKRKDRFFKPNFLLETQLLDFFFNIFCVYGSPLFLNNLSSILSLNLLWKSLGWTGH